MSIAEGSSDEPRQPGRPSRAPLLLIAVIAILTSAGGMIGVVLTDPPPRGGVAQTPSPRVGSPQSGGSGPPGSSATPVPAQTGPVRVNVLGGESRWESAWISRVVIAAVLLLLDIMVYIIFSGPRSEAAQRTLGVRRGRRAKREPDSDG